MKLFNTLLRKIKYNLRYLFGVKISIPSEFKLFERRKTNYEKFINTYCKPSLEDEVNLNDSLKIFGKVSNEYQLSKDIFSNYDFSNKFSEHQYTHFPTVEDAAKSAILLAWCVQTPFCSKYPPCMLDCV